MSESERPGESGTESLEAWFRDVSRHKELVEDTLTSVMRQAKKQHRFKCRKCGEQNNVRVDDASAQTRAAEVVANQLQKTAEFLARAKEKQAGSGPDWGILAGYPLEVKEAVYARLEAELAREAA